MKTLIILALIALGVWYYKTQADKKNSAVKEVEKVFKAPEKYVKNLQSDVSKAKDIQDAASKKIKAEEAEINKALDEAK